MERVIALQPTKDLLNWLPMMIVNSQGVDYKATDPAVLAIVADAAEITMNVLHNGIGSIGDLLAHSAVAIEDGSIGADSIESLGHLMAELGALAADCMVLATRCRRETPVTDQAATRHAEVTRDATTDKVRDGVPPKSVAGGQVVHAPAVTPKHVAGNEDVTCKAPPQGDCDGVTADSPKGGADKKQSRLAMRSSALALAAKEAVRRALE